MALLLFCKTFPSFIAGMGEIPFFPGRFRVLQRGWANSFFVDVSLFYSRDGQYYFYLGGFRVLAGIGNLTFFQDISEFYSRDGRY